MLSIACISLVLHSSFASFLIPRLTFFDVPKQAEPPKGVKKIFDQSHSSSFLLNKLCLKSKKNRTKMLTFWLTFCFTMSHFMNVRQVRGSPSSTNGGSQPAPPPDMSSSTSVIAECTVVPKTAECAHLGPGSHPFVECCLEKCQGNRMYTKRRVYTPMTQHSWWKNYTTECLCCWDGGANSRWSSFVIVSILLLIIYCIN